MRWTSVAASLATLWPVALVAQDNTVGGMLQDCERPDYEYEAEIVRSIYCSGLAAGIAYMMEANCSTAAAGTSTPDPDLSSQGDLSGGAAVQVFVEWARAHPERWGDEVRDGIRTALAEMRPCAAAQ